MHLVVAESEFSVVGKGHREGLQRARSHIRLWSYPSELRLNCS